jgi:hypothetical protein
LTTHFPDGLSNCAPTTRVLKAQSFLISNFFST